MKDILLRTRIIKCTFYSKKIHLKAYSFVNPLNPCMAKTVFKVYNLIKSADSEDVIWIFCEKSFIYIFL